MVKYLKSTFLVFFALSIPISITGCAVAVVGAIGAAGVSTVDKPNDKNKEPAVKVYPLEVRAQPVEQVFEPAAQSTTLPAAEAQAVDNQVVDSTVLSPPAPDESTAPTISLAVDEPSQVTSLDFPVGESQAALSAEVAASSDTPSLPTARKAINNTSFEHLVEHPWKLVGMRGVTDFTFDANQSVFVFSKHGDFKALLSCNFISGRFAADDGGKFLLSKLNFSHKTCTTSRDQEVAIVSMLLDANEFFINGETLMLGMQGKSILAFSPTEKHLDLNEVNKTTEVKRPAHVKPKARHIKSRK